MLRGEYWLAATAPGWQSPPPRSPSWRDDVFWRLSSGGFAMPPEVGARCDGGPGAPGGPGGFVVPRVLPLRSSSFSFSSLCSFRCSFIATPAHPSPSRDGAVGCRLQDVFAPPADSLALVFARALARPDLPLLPATHTCALLTAELRYARQTTGPRLSFAPSRDPIFLSVQGSLWRRSLTLCFAHVQAHTPHPCSVHPSHAFCAAAGTCIPFPAPAAARIGHSTRVLYSTPLPTSSAGG